MANGMQNGAVTSDERGAAQPGPLYVYVKASSLAALEAECATLRRQRDDVRTVLGAACGESVTQAAERVRDRAAEAKRLAHEAEAQREAAVRERDEMRARLAGIDNAAAKAGDVLREWATQIETAPLDVPVRRVGAHALPLPAYAKPGDAGMDLRTPHDVHVQSYSRKRIPCGFAFAIPEGYEGQVRPKSGLSEKCIDVALGTIDSCYRGEVEALVVNNGTGTMTFKAGDKIAQIVFCPVARATLREVDALDETERGASGFGSTGAR